MEERALLLTNAAIGALRRVNPGGSGLRLAAALAGPGLSPGGDVSCWVALDVVVYLNAPEEVLTQRLLDRASQAGRADDVADVIRHRHLRSS